MNPQPYQTPPQWWESRLSERFVRAWSVVRNYELRSQQIAHIESQQASRVRELLDQGYGVLIAANHSFHFDSYALIEAGLRAGWVAHFMTAWQVFGLTGRLGKWLLQKHGCFSINREGSDSKAFRYAVQLLVENSHPLVLFPEGDIYHSNDRILPFREGVGSLALVAQKRTERPLVIIPCGMKAHYVEDPSKDLQAMMERLEAHVGWQPRTDHDLVDRIYRFGNGFLSLKEVEYLGHPQTGTLPQRIKSLAEIVLAEVRQRNNFVDRGKDLPDRIKHVRGQLIKSIEQIQKEDDNARNPADGEPALERLRRDMNDVFFTTQLSSYHGDYTAEHPTIERIAEAIDKFEEDVFALQCPTPRGRRQVSVVFGDPIPVNEHAGTAADLTTQIEQAVQGLLDDMSGAAVDIASKSG